jgi:hypothetical protein
MHANIFFEFLLYKNMICNFLISFERLSRLHEDKTLFYCFIFFLLRRKLCILISDYLYLYSIKIQINIKKNWWKHTQKNHKFFKWIF